MTDKSKSQDEETPIDRRSADIGIVCTHNAEIKPLLKALDRGKKYVEDGAVFRGGFLDEVIRIAVVEAGPGFAKHRSVTQSLIKEHRPSWILSVGFSSGLTDDLQAGDICLANEICDTHGNAIPVKCPIPETKRILVRKHAVADSHPQTVVDKQQLAVSTGAVACDSTSLAVAQACHEQPEESSPIRFLSVRAIVDSFDEAVPQKALSRLFEPPAKKKPTPVTGLLGRFKRDPELDPWTSRADELAVNLNRFLRSLIRQLGEKLGKTRY